ncbi:MAG: electron transport complex subunit RsxG [Marinobacter sp.]|uniref:electron transport complex subunit RsxG n=1 Tax=Marinobacter sp. TaxID=50741 RepID=UPI001B69F607|nr:electron transport complex subunit RsxG [Marinobacter sp.]MBQ0745157.1 electron transport complex subunit RsxG [Marinobacter sp.]MBQ0814189.1 electron transport complex subunit RsxG [Marinobacter sp.]|tara:strand:+ start:894 stop:1595 length:702 start_codon:yes stop_codon:yes gene_type:complete
MATMTQSIRRSAIGLGLFAVITGGTIAVTQALTEERIAEQAARAEAKALFEIIPESAHNNDILRDTLILPASDRLATGGPLTVWVARQDGRPVGMIMPAIAPDGYSGNIKLLVGIDLEGTVLGVRVIGHKETPGLGDRIEIRKSDWVKDFEGRSLGNPPPREWNVKKNGGVFDQFTGATITPRAVVKAVQKSLIYFRQNQQVIRAQLNKTPTGQGPAFTPGDLTDETLNAEQS